MMTKLIPPTDPQYFCQTSDGNYDRHRYKLCYNSGKTEIYDSWEVVQNVWFQSPSGWLSHIEVLDKKQDKKTKGFS
jgi:hypothetical protein